MIHTLNFHKIFSSISWQPQSMLSMKPSVLRLYFALLLLLLLLFFILSCIMQDWFYMSCFQLEAEIKKKEKMWKKKHYYKHSYTWRHLESFQEVAKRFFPINFKKNKYFIIIAGYRRTTRIVDIHSKPQHPLTSKQNFCNLKIVMINAAFFLIFRDVTYAKGGKTNLKRVEAWVNE